MTSIYGAGRLDRPVRIDRRTSAAIGHDGGTHWANLRPTGSKAEDFGGIPVHRREGVATLRANAVTRSLLPGDRLAIEGVSYDIGFSVVTDARSGMVAFDIAETVDGPLLGAAFSAYGRRVTLKRVRANQAPIVVSNVRARLWGASPEEVAAGIKSTARHVLVLAADVPASLLPLQSQDTIEIDGLTLRFGERPDDQSHRDGETLLAIKGMVQ